MRVYLVSVDVGRTYGGFQGGSRLLVGAAKRTDEVISSSSNLRPSDNYIEENNEPDVQFLREVCFAHKMVIFRTDTNVPQLGEDDLVL